jgi:hypothetical protein
MGLTTAELAEVVAESVSASEAAGAGAGALEAAEATAAADAAAAGGTAAASSGVSAAIIGAAKSFAISYALAKLFSRDTNLSNGGTAQSFLANTLSSADPIPVIYGRRRVGASVVEVALTPTLVQADNLHRVCIWGEGPISAVSALYMDAVISTDDRYQQGGNPAFVAEHHLGADDQAASAYMIANIADAAKWNASCTLSGIAYSYVTMVWNPTVFTHGRPVMTADVDGRTLTDPRTGTIAFSRNPALAIRDYLVNARYGRGVDTSMIDDTAFADAAWHCEDQTSVPDGAGGTTLQARYTCDGVLNVDQPVLDNLRALLTSCRGFLVFSGGKYKLKIDRDETVPGASFGYDFTGGAARQFAGGADTPLTVTRAGNTATRVNSTGVIETVAADTARLDYDPLTHACRGLRIEEARTSYCLWNADLTNGVWTPGGATVSANVGTAPDGTATMDALIEDGTTGTHRISQGIATIQRNQFVEASWFVKRHAGTRNLAIQITDGGANYDYIQFDLDAKTASSSGAAGNGVHVSAGVDDYGGGVYRCWLVGKVDATVGTAGFSFYAYLVNVASNSYTGDGASGLRLWGGMVAATTASIPTSVILTTSAAVTRNVDVPTIAPGSWYRAAAFSMLVEFIEPYNTGTPARLVGLRGSNDADTPLYVNGTKIGMFDGANGGAEPALDTANSFTLGATSRGAMGYTQGVGVSISLNGGTCATRTNANWDWGTTTAIHLGQQPGGTNVLMAAHLRLHPAAALGCGAAVALERALSLRPLRRQHRRRLVDRARRQAQPLQPGAGAVFQPGRGLAAGLRGVRGSRAPRGGCGPGARADARPALHGERLHGGADRADRGAAQPLRHARLAHRDDRRHLPRGGRRGAGAHATPGWPAAGDPAEGKLFRVIEMELLSSDEVRLTLLEYQAAVYSSRRLRRCARWRRPRSRTCRSPRRRGRRRSPRCSTRRRARPASRAAPRSAGARPTTPSCSRAAGTSSSARRRGRAAGRSTRRSRARGAASPPSASPSTTSRPAPTTGAWRRSTRSARRAPTRPPPPRRSPASTRRPRTSRTSRCRATPGRRSSPGTSPRPRPTSRWCSRRRHLRALVAEDFRRRVGPRLARQPRRLPGRHLDRLRAADDRHLHGEALERARLLGDRGHLRRHRGADHRARDARHGRRVAGLCRREVERRRGRRRHPARRHHAHRRDAHQHRHLERDRLARRRAGSGSYTFANTLDLGSKQAARLFSNIDRRSASRPTTWSTAAPTRSTTGAWSTATRSRTPR